MKRFIWIISLLTLWPLMRVNSSLLLKMWQLY